MTIDWHSLLLVTIATLLGAVAVVGAVSLGIIGLSAADGRAAAGRSGTAMRALSGLGFAVAGGLVLYGLYLIIPAFH